MFSIEKSFDLKTPPCIAELVDQELIIINLDTGNYYNIRGIAVQVWNALLTGVSYKSLKKNNDWDDKATQLVQEFIEKCLADDLIEESESLSDQIVKINNDVLLEGLVFDKFTDMQEIIGLDPIHETDEKLGWPHKPN